MAKRSPKRRGAKRRGPLALWLMEHGHSLTSAAQAFGCSVQHVSNLVHGHGKPSREIAVAIEHATGGAVTVASCGR